MSELDLDTARLSPSLVWARREGPPAFEMKFLVDETTATAVEAWASTRLDPDPHGDPSLGGAYRTTTMYLDGPGLELYRGTGSRKYRLRRYGNEAALFLECKTRKQERVRKRRTMVPQGDLDFLAGVPYPDDWQAAWFATALERRGLRPACQITYQRTAYIGAAPEGPVRLTLDRRLRGTLNDSWKFLPGEGRLPFLTEKVVLEMKFRSTLPGAFKECLQTLQLASVPVSKYRNCLAAWGIPATTGGAVDA